MSGRRSVNGAMLDLWRPPKDAGDPVGCLATTYTFTPALFDEQCLARFLEIESEPNREDLAFLIERESRLGGIYAGVIVDYTQAGVEHSLRWDVIPVRLKTGKQHAKLSVLEWTRYVRIIVSSANLSEPGYRSNYEVAVQVDLTPESADIGLLGDAVGFLKVLLRHVPGASEELPEVRRATGFLTNVQKKVRGWTPRSRRGSIWQKLVFTVPGSSGNGTGRSSLDEAIAVCRQNGNAPADARIASPFFDTDEETNRAAAHLCRQLARGTRHDVGFCVPIIRDENAAAITRIAAPKSLLLTATSCHADVSITALPETDDDGNRRPWHAKMLACHSDRYTALMVGSSNFTCAGMGIGQYRNTEANLLTIAKLAAYGRERGQLDGIWPKMDDIADPDSTEWLGAVPEREEEEQQAVAILPEGFLSATYWAGEKRKIVLRLDPDHLPGDWRVNSCGQDATELLSADAWRTAERMTRVEIPWAASQPPEKLLVQWEGEEAFLPLNVEEGRHLPPPNRLESMSADDMLFILAAADPSAAFRVWAGRQQSTEAFDGELDSATPADLDPLQRYDLQETFLHRVRHRARVLAQLRSNLQQPAWGLQALEWRLRGLVGIEQLANRLLRELKKDGGMADEALLAIADFLIVLREVDYTPVDGSLSKKEFEDVYRPFLQQLAERLGREIREQPGRFSRDVLRFWDRVERNCRR